MSNTLNTITTIQSLREVTNIIDQCEIQLSFFGSPYLTCDQAEGTISLDEIIDIFQKFALDTQNYSADDRRAGRELYTKIQEFESEADRQIADSYLFEILRAIASVINCFFCTDTFQSGSRVDQLYSDRFLGYTRDQWTQGPLPADKFVGIGGTFYYLVEEGNL